MEGEAFSPMIKRYNALASDDTNAVGRDGFDGRVRRLLEEHHVGRDVVLLGNPLDRCGFKRADDRIKVELELGVDAVEHGDHFLELAHGFQRRDGRFRVDVDKAQVVREFVGADVQDGLVERRQVCVLDEKHDGGVLDGLDRAHQARHFAIFTFQRGSVEQHFLGHIFRAALAAAAVAAVVFVLKDLLDRLAVLLVLEEQIRHDDHDAEDKDALQHAKDDHQDERKVRDKVHERLGIAEQVGHESTKDERHPQEAAPPRRLDVAGNVLPLELEHDAARAEEEHERQERVRVHAGDLGLVRVQDQDEARRDGEEGEDDPVARPSPLVLLQEERRHDAVRREATHQS